MKKLLLVLFMCILSLNMFSSNYGDKIKFINNKHGFITIGGGVLNQHNDIMAGCLQMGLLYGGVYLDFSIVPTKGAGSTDVGYWDAKGGGSVRVGYQFPITRKFRIIPTIGYVRTSSGEVNGYDYTITSNGVSNKYTADTALNKFDVGGVFVYVHKSFTATINYSTNTAGCAFGFHF